MIVVNNSGFIQSSNSFFITKTTGEFCLELNKLLKKRILLFQFSEFGVLENGINDFEVNRHFNFKTVNFLRGYKKFFSYFIAFFTIIKTVSVSKEFFYIFYPGNFSYLVAFFCYLLNKPYGLYVRGEYSISRSGFLFRKAKFVNTVGLVFLKEIQVYNNNCNLIRPMVQFDFSNNCVLNNQLKKNVILFVGRIEKRKGVFEIIEAASKIKSVFPDYIFRLIGAGNDSEEIANLIIKKGLDNVILHGPVFVADDLARFYQESRIFLFPSHDEGFPRVLYEAMYFNVPIITTFVGNISGIMENEYNCLRIDVRSPDSIFDQLNLLISNFNIQDLLVKNASKTLSLVFNNEVKEHSVLLKEQIEKSVN